MYTVVFASFAFWGAEYHIVRHLYIYIRLQVLRIRFAASSLDMQRGGVQRVPGRARGPTYQRCRVRTVRVQGDSLALRTQEEEHDQQGQEKGQGPECWIDHSAQFAGRGQGTDYIHPIRGSAVNALRVLHGTWMVHRRRWFLLATLSARSGGRGRCRAHQLAGVHIQFDRTPHHASELLDIREEK